MEFLHPAILWGLCALAIPIIIHLFYFRRFKKVYFSNVKFLQEIKEETNSRNKLKNLLILLSRLLALAALILAFAQPFISKGQEVQKGTKAVSIFVDNSFSMRALSSDIPLFDKAKQKAIEIINAFSSEDQFQILSHDLSVKEQRLLTKEDAISAIEALDLSPEVKTLDRIYNRQIQAMESAADINSLYFLSDFQKSICTLDSELDSFYSMNFVPFQSVQESNVSIDSVWLASPVIVPNQINKLVIRSVNHSDNDVEDIRITIDQNGSVKPLGQIDIKARSASIDTANVNVIKTGWQNFKIKVNDYPIEFDNEYLLSFDVPKTKKVLSLNGSVQNKYLQSVFGGISYFEIDNKTVGKFQYEQLKEYDLVILNEIRNFSSGLSAELSNFIIEGGNCLFFPSKNGDIENYNKLMNSLGVDVFQSLNNEKKEVSTINTRDFVFSEVYTNNRKNLKLPITQSNYELSQYSNRGREDLLNYRDGKSLLSKYNKGNGFLYLSSAPLNTKENNLPLNAEVFVPMLYKMALAKAKSTPGSYTIGVNQNIAVAKQKGIGENNFKITGPKDFIPRQSTVKNQVIIGMEDQIEAPGFYDLAIQNNTVQKLAYNYDRLESDLSYLNSGALKERFEPLGIQIIENAQNVNFTELIGEKEHGVALWKWCLIFALIFLAVETLLIRFWK